MTTDPALARFTEALTGPATTAELAAEAEVVGQMHDLIGSTTGATAMIKSIFGHKVAAAATAMVLGASGVAAASGSVPLPFDDESTPVETVVEEIELPEIEVEDTVVEEIEPTEEDAPAEDLEDGAEDEVLPPTNEAGEPYGDVACDEAENHGEYVSGVAQDDSIEGPRGQVVSQAAKTDCGKSDDADERDDDADDADESDDDAGERDDESEDDERDDESEDDERDDESEDDDNDDDDDDDDEQRGNGNRDNGNGKGPNKDK